MMWIANYGGRSVRLPDVRQGPAHAVDARGNRRGRRRAEGHSCEYTKAWSVQASVAVGLRVLPGATSSASDLGWFWYYWLFTTESVDGSITGVRRDGEETVVTVRQDGQMPSPVVLKVSFADGAKPQAMDRAVFQDDGSALVTWPVDVWFDGARTFEARLRFGSAEIIRIELDPRGRFPDAELSDNVWPR